MKGLIFGGVFIDKEESCSESIILKEGQSLVRFSLISNKSVV